MKYLHNCFQCIEEGRTGEGKHNVSPDMFLCDACYIKHELQPRLKELEKKLRTTEYNLKASERMRREASDSFDARKRRHQKEVDRYKHRRFLMMVKYHQQEEARLK